ncbi:hypothetical protein SF12_09870 [Streptomyces sp. MBRL 601]|nr:hypothetical protein SF12_09870 [Streptomyces sp. MBRL 601]
MDAGPFSYRDCSATSLGSVDLHPVGDPADVDAVARALLGRVGHVTQQRQRHRGGRPGLLEQFVVGALHVRQAVDVQFEHLGRVLHTDAVTGTKVLVDPDLQRLARAGPGLLLHRHLSCRFPAPDPSRPGQVEGAPTGVEQPDDTTGGFPRPEGGYGLDVRESARVKIGHTPESL